MGVFFVDQQKSFENKNSLEDQVIVFFLLFEFYNYITTKLKSKPTLKQINKN